MICAMAKKHAPKPKAGTSPPSTHLPMTKLPELLDQLTALKDSELVLIKAHMVVERVLTEALAARLRTTADSVPRLSYGVLVDLAVRPASRKELIWFNDLRNQMAHEFNPLEKDGFTSILAKFEITWPKNAGLRLAITGALGQYVLVLAWRELLNNLFGQLTLQRASELPASAKEVLEIYSSLTSKLDEFHTLVKQVPPGL